MYITITYCKTLLKNLKKGAMPDLQGYFETHYLIKNVKNNFFFWIEKCSILIIPLLFLKQKCTRHLNVKEK